MNNQQPTKNNRKCIHNKRKILCKDCFGSCICIHGKQAYYCIDCGGKGRCKHGKERYYCKDCGGKGICEHNRRKSNCSLCKKKQELTKHICENIELYMNSLLFQSKYVNSREIFIPQEDVSDLCFEFWDPIEFKDFEKLDEVPIIYNL